MAAIGPIDCDVHPTCPGIKSLLPYMDDMWRETVIRRGIDDLTLRLKMNFWGNDAGDTAFALMPFVTLPTHGREFGDQRHVTGGLIAPLAFTLPGEWS